MNPVTHTKGFRRLSATALCGVIASSFAALPAAADSFSPLEVTVKFGDLDVSSPQGAAVLYNRIWAAAEQVCSPFESSRLGAKMRLDACIDKAISTAIATVGQPELSRVYGAKRRTSAPFAPIFAQIR